MLWSLPWLDWKGKIQKRINSQQWKEQEEAYHGREVSINLDWEHPKGVLFYYKVFQKRTEKVEGSEYPKNWRKPPFLRSQTVWNT